MNSLHSDTLLDPSMLNPSRWTAQTTLDDSPLQPILLVLAGESSLHK